MTLSKRRTVDNDGRSTDIISFGDAVDLDRIELTFDPKHDERIYASAYQDGENVYQTVFKRRQLQFTPLSTIGRGEIDRLEGVSEAKAEELDTDDEAVPDGVELALKSLGFTSVPSGDWWVSE